MPARTLEEALRSMRWSLEPSRFLLIGFPGRPTPQDLEVLVGCRPAQLVLEPAETTLLVEEGAARGLVERHPRARVERGLRWIRFEAEMDWQLTGFLALVSGRLAEAGVPLGVVCSFGYDHLFVAEEHLPVVRRVLGELFAGAEPG